MPSLSAVIGNSSRTPQPIGGVMTTREELLQRLWGHINCHVIPYHVGRALVREDELDRIVGECKQRPDKPFGDAGAALERILGAGAQRRDLCLLLRYAAYNAVFSTLYEIDPEGAGVDCKHLVGLYECLLSADPSGMEGRPGSADAVTTMHRPS
jgi:hypothetical protein